ncbi:hypothetical protein EJ05DRAFT_515605 [Pseudovirgaria hyperparasitica]|uniref:Uncharacterized protein n=1 Tax=Pseudovirgaria hyperparasitica TaxID=470096 RepID=A0A6A6VQU5_9PEZI|nr:uncharacterized protein EJ05DRAFT_515605 [Pseudovirgaria hyperparasitica]KAF2752505.1 hypothetical protein EJ05DRAFT_515605 [Pseudovirgaria hyperparasitica]
MKRSRARRCSRAYHHWTELEMALLAFFKIFGRKTFKDCATTLQNALKYQQRRSLASLRSRLDILRKRHPGLWEQGWDLKMGQSVIKESLLQYHDQVLFSKYVDEYIQQLYQEQNVKRAREQESRDPPQSSTESILNLHDFDLAQDTAGSCDFMSGANGSPYLIESELRSLDYQPAQLIDHEYTIQSWDSLQDVLWRPYEPHSSDCGGVPSVPTEQVARLELLMVPAL